MNEVSYERDITICVLDDEQNDLKLFNMACAQFSFANVVLNSSMRDFKDFVQGWQPQTSFAIFFLDVKIGVETSFDLCRDIRCNECLSLSPVVFMSSGDLQNDVKMAIQSGGNCYIHKPTGSKARIDMIISQLEYWTSKVTLPLLSSKSERNTLGFSNIHNKSSKEPSSARSRGTNFYLVDRLRQDILVGLLRDLEGLIDRDIQASIKDRVERVTTRFAEIFEFRVEVFERPVIDKVNLFCEVVRKFFRIGMQSTERKKILNHAKSIRIELSQTLREKNYQKFEGGSAFVKMDYLIWEVFQELADSPSFPHVYQSLKRFRERVF